MNELKEKLVELLAWAIETQRKAPTRFYRDYYGGYIQAIKDAISMLELRLSDVTGDKSE